MNQEQLPEPFPVSLRPNELVLVRTALVRAMSELVRTGSEDIANRQRHIVMKIDAMLALRFGESMVEKLEATDKKYHMVDYSQPFGGEENNEN